MGHVSSRASLFTFGSVLLSLATLAATSVPARAVERARLPGPSVPSPTPTPYPQTLYATNDDLKSGGVYEFDGNKPGPPSRFFAFPAAQAVAVDDQQNFYVSQLNDPPQFIPDVVEVLALSQIFVYSNGDSSPMGITVTSGANGFLEVANDTNEPSLGFYGFLIYPQQQNTPTQLSDPNLTYVLCVLVDAAGIMYLGGVNQSGKPEVDVFAPGLGWSNLGLNLAGQPLGLAFDSSGNMVVAEATVGVAVFKPSSHQPSGWIDHGGKPLSIAFGNGGRWLYVLSSICDASSVCSAHVFVYRYPQAAQGAAIGFAEAQYAVPAGTTAFGFAQGIAVSPRVPLFNPSAYRRQHPGFKYWTDIAHPRS